MPCTDGGYPYEKPQPRKYNGLTAEQLEAVLCGVFTVLEEASGVIRPNGSLTDGNVIADVMERVDWKEAGVTRKDAVAWWTRHKAADDIRRRREHAAEQERIRLETLRESGLNKLTAAERLALGILDGPGMPWGNK